MAWYGWVLGGVLGFIAGMLAGWTGVAIALLGLFVGYYLRGQEITSQKRKKKKK